MSGRACSSCEFAVMQIIDEPGDSAGDPVMRCYRYPPILVFDPNAEEVLEIRPDADSWCGEYRPATE